MISKAYSGRAEAGLQRLGSLEVWVLDAVGDEQNAVPVHRKQRGYMGMCKRLKAYQLKMKEAR